MVRIHEPGFGTSSSLSNYEILVKCGSGTYGSVYRAVHKSTRRVVALKKVTKYPLEDGCPVECKYLEQLCPSRNIVNMLEYFYSTDGQLVLVFEYMEMDLWKLISGPNSNVPLLQMKCIMKQLFEGLYQCHTAGIMHRDVKPSNLLINGSGVLKLADFGLTTSFVKPPYLSSNVVSLYYRPPELLMGSHDYGPEIDIWSAGCILVELLTNDYLFAGSNESDQLDMIFKVFGTPNESRWPGVSHLPGWGLVESGKRHPARDLYQNYQNLDSNALDLASRLLQLDPKKRISSLEALSHPWFSASPLPCLPNMLPNLWRDNKKAQAQAHALPPPLPPAPVSIPDPLPLPPLLPPNVDPNYDPPMQCDYPDNPSHNLANDPQNNNYNGYNYNNHGNDHMNNNNYQMNQQNFYNLNTLNTLDTINTLNTLNLNALNNLNAMNNFNNYNMQTNYYYWNQQNAFAQNNAAYNYYVNQMNYLNNNFFNCAYQGYNNYYNPYPNMNSGNIYFSANNDNNNFGNYGSCSSAYANQYDGRQSGNVKDMPARKDGRRTGYAPHYYNAKA